MKSKNPHKALEILGKYKRVIWPVVDSYLQEPVFPKEFAVPAKYRQFVDTTHWQMLRDYPERKGKYVRGSIIMLVSEAMGIPNKKAVKTAAAMQISEDWILIHDDLQDNSVSRRGKPTLHRIHGTELAVNAGDGLHNLMWKVLVDNISLLGPITSQKILNEFYIMLSRTVLGQTVEIAWTDNLEKEVNDDEWFFIADGKTGYYTMAGPARLGGIIAGANDKQLESLTEFGFYLGRCFQLIDDILDVTSNFAGLKELGNDIYEGKKTLLLGHLARNLKRADSQKLFEILKKDRDKKNEKEVLWVIDMMKKAGSIDYAFEIAKDFKEKALEVFDKKLNFLKNEPSRSDIKTLTDFILERNY